MSAPAGLGTRVAAQGRWETVSMLRNGEQLLLAVVLPLLALIGLTFVDLLDGYGSRRVDLATPGVLALCVVSTAFTGQGIATGFDRRYGVLRYLSTTPLGRGGLIAGKAIAVLAVLILQAVVIGAVALLLGWRPDPAGLLIAVVLLVLGAACFTSLGLLVAGTVRPEATLAITNLLWVLLAGAGGLLLPTGRLPGWLNGVVDALPSAALGNALRTALTTGALDVGPLLVLLVWTVAASLAAVRWFRWD
ncbi:ABC transporter permease [Tersicoccus sp. Bi-70]|uniref:ABC transporter permease n=1 Tax=Tersicoccus sp. Bi-70 TaxID=1897634 RepID=UPI00097871CC|nr:ABC transporter permease [Tersicoccus sp. Bi-70]OMH33059.1 ABC transporter [Tersicoccus sp. Bi-70]